MKCPECYRTMTQLPCERPSNYAPDVPLEKWHCHYCRLTAKVETTFSHDDVVGSKGQNSQ